MNARDVRLAGDVVMLAADCWEPAGTPCGQTVVLLHGGGQTRHSWRQTGARLAASGRRVFAVDARGHGDSQWAVDGDYSIAAHSKDVTELVAGLPGHRVLVGASLGGMAALTAQAHDSALAAALVLVDIVPKAEPEGLRKIHDFMTSGLSGFATIDDAVAAVAAYNPRRTRPPRPDGLRKNLRHREGRWYWHWDPRILEHRENAVHAALAREAQARAHARRITVPTLVIHGAQSDVVSDSGVADLLGLIDDSRSIDVAGTGHMVGGDDNDVFTESLLGFLDDVQLTSTVRNR